MRRPAKVRFTAHLTGQITSEASLALTRAVRTAKPAGSSRKPTRRYRARAGSLPTWVLTAMSCAPAARNQ